MSDLSTATTVPELCCEFAELDDCDCCEVGDCQDYNGDCSCSQCFGAGERMIEHCCACGGSPYCNCCRLCRAECVAKCTCPITVDGITVR